MDLSKVFLHILHNQIENGIILEVRDEKQFGYVEPWNSKHYFYKCTFLQLIIFRFGKEVDKYLIFLLAWLKNCIISQCRLWFIRQLACPLSNLLAQTIEQWDMSSTHQELLTYWSLHKMGAILQMPLLNIFPARKMLYFYSNFGEMCLQVFNSWQLIIGFSNGLVAKRWPTIS